MNDEFNVGDEFVLRRYAHICINPCTLAHLDFHIYYSAQTCFAHGQYLFQ